MRVQQRINCRINNNKTIWTKKQRGWFIEVRCGTIKKKLEKREIIVGGGWKKHGTSFWQKRTKWGKGPLKRWTSEIWKQKQKRERKKTAEELEEKSVSSDLHRQSYKRKFVFKNYIFLLNYLMVHYFKWGVLCHFNFNYTSVI